MVEYQFYFVGTPIGNLKDISYRAEEILSSVDVVLAEDTRKTRILLRHYGIDVSLLSYHDHNKERVTPKIMRMLEEGKSVALVTDAGTPLISDPGYYILRRLISEGISFTVIPGPSAVTAALVLSGLPTDKFTFFGYVPKKSGQRKRILEEVRKHPYTSILFETPHRLVRTLEEISDLMPGREIVVARELTKMHEEVVRGPVEEVLGKFEKRKVRGEITLLVRGVG